MLATNCKTEYLRNPLGIDVTEPLFSWNCEGGLRQSAAELQVSDETGLVWTSGRVDTGRMHLRYDGPALHSRQRLSWRVRLFDETDCVGEWSEEAFFEMGLLEEADWRAQWINPEFNSDSTDRRPASYLKKKFTLPAGSLQERDARDGERQARLYVTAHGLYEVWVNLKRVGDFVLAPGCYDYEKHIGYQTYDVTKNLVEGENTVEVILGDGWYRSVSGVDGIRDVYGADVALLFQLEVGGKGVCVSDATWEAAQDGPLRENDMQQGEVVDARKAPCDYHAVKVEPFSKSNLICSNCVPICERERFSGKLITTPNGGTVIDYGQNLAGYIEFTVDAHAGDRITLYHGETLDENGNFTQENFQDRKRHKEGGIRQSVCYTCKEGRNHYKTKFSIWGFRYGLVETEVDLSHASFTAIAVYSDMEELTEFTCGNDLVNRLYQNSLWSQKSNFCDVPTDCPTRERAAWTGDMGVFADTGLMLMDAYPVMRKWLAECRLAQYPDGRIANIAPKNKQPGFFAGLMAGSVGWGDACILVPLAMYRRYGDVRILSENYEMMRRWYAYLEKRAKKRKFSIKGLFRHSPYSRYTIETGIDYGEWCEPDVENTAAMRTPQGKVATAYLAYSGRLMAEIAGILGCEEDRRHYEETSHLAMLAWREIATKNGRIYSDRQADYVRALTFHLLEGEEAGQAAADLDALVREKGYHLNTGFLSTPHLTRVLCDYGYVDTAYRLLLQETCPGWLYEVKRGATTIWETWDGVNEKGEPKESLNHYSYGAISGWLVDGVCGIVVEGEHIVLKPHPYPALGYARACYLSPCGKIVSGWRYEGDSVNYEIEIPAGVEALLVLPGEEARTLVAGTYHFTKEEKL